MKNIFKKYLLLLFTIWSFTLSGQIQDTITTDSTEYKQVYTTANQFSNERIGDEDIQCLTGNVQIFHDSVFIYCDSAIVKGQEIKAMQNVVILQNDSMRLFADTMYYNKDSMKAELINRVVILNADNKMYSNHIFYNMNTKIATYYDTASFFLRRTKLKSVKGIYNAAIEKATFIEKVNIVDSLFQLRSDTLDFFTSQEKLVFRAPTRIDQSSKKIYCESGYYDIKNGLASFEQNAEFQDPVDKTDAKADIIFYNSNTDDVKLTGNAIYKDNKQLATGNKIVYKKSNNSFDIVGNAYYKNEDKQMSGESIHYDEITKKLVTRGRSKLEEDGSMLEANLIDFNQDKGEGIAKGDVVLTDLSNESVVYGDQMDISDNNEKVKVYGIENVTYLTQVMEGDTMFLTADTLFTLNKVDSTNKESKFIRAYNNVKIFKSDMQAVADSLTYDNQNEKISLFKQPLIWSDTSQFVGDTVHIYFENNKIRRVVLAPNAFITQSQDEFYFNQISGKKIIITFNDSTISRMDVIGNAESVFYMTDDDKKYIGVSKTIATDMRFDFINGDISRSMFAPKPFTEVLPMKTTDHEGIKLKAFSWNPERRPKDVEDILQKAEPNITSAIPKIKDVNKD